MTNHHTTPESPAAETPHAAAPARESGWLWISAGVLAAFTLVQGAGLLDRTATAEMVTQKAGYTMMTTSGGSSDVIVVLDDRNEVLMVYSVENRRQVVLQDRQPLPELFQRARQQAGLPPRP
jgi:hypothetical protein